MLSSPREPVKKTVTVRAKAMTGTKKGKKGYGPMAGWIVDAKGIRRAPGFRKKKELEKIKEFKKVSESLDEASFADYMAQAQAARDRVKQKHDNRKKKDAAYIDRVKKGVKFYDKKGSGRLVKGKKVYD
jgi:hypothetical protein